MRVRYTSSFLQVCSIVILINVGGCGQSHKAYKAGTLDDSLHATPYGVELRKHGGENGKIVVDKIVPYIDGACGEFHYREDGKLLSTKEYYEPNRSGVRKLKSEATFAPNGAVLTGKLLRTDGTTRMSAELLSDGSRLRSFYWPKSNRLYMRQKTGPNRSSRQEVIFRESGAIFAKVTADKSHWWRDQCLEVFREDESRQYGIDELDGFRRVIVYRGCGVKIDHISYWKYAHDQLLGGYNHLYGLDEYDSQGLLARSVLFNDFEGRITPLACQVPSKEGWMVLKFSGASDRSAEGRELLSWRDGKGELKQRLLMPFGHPLSVELPDGTAMPVDKPPPLEEVDIWRVKEPHLSAFEEYRKKFQAENLNYAGINIAKDPLRWYLLDD